MFCDFPLNKIESNVLNNKTKAKINNNLNGKH